MLRVLILGSSGFLGRHLVDELMENDNMTLTGFGRKADSRLSPPHRFIQGDYADRETLKKALADQDVVYHFVSQTIPSSSWDNPMLEIEKNLIPTLRMIELASESGVRKICFPSSGGTVYGTRQSALNESAPTEPFSPYGIVKRTVESFLQYANVKHGINYDIYRISNVYGEGQDTGKGLGFINTALEHIIDGRPVVVYGDGENVRDYIYVKDVVKLLAFHALRDLKTSDICNVSSNCSISLNELLVVLKNVTGIDFEVQYLPGRLNDNRTVIIDNAKILGSYRGFLLTSLEEGIKNTYSFLKNRSAYVKKSV